jgi:predicted DNA-binding antitoxin AbrB/MazE fold protein
MSKAIDAIYENGVFKPLEKVSLKEHERVHIIIEELKKVESTALDTSGIIPVRSSKVVDIIALEPEFLPEEV